MNQRLREALEKLDEIGGWVSGAEILHHLGSAAYAELHEAAADGLVDVRTEFTLTDAGAAAVAETDRRAA